MPGNQIAYMMLYLWPVVAWALYTRLDPARALVWTILGGYMVLPPLTAIDLPMVPDFDKYSIPNLAAAAAVVFLLKERFSLWPSSLLARMLIMLYVLSPFATVLSNGDRMFFEHASLPAMRIYDSLAAVAGQFIVLLPFFMARKYLATPKAQRAVLVGLVTAGVIYSLPMAWEARMSPQINLMIYGFFQHDFSQAVRFGGYRPFVFMPHALWVAFFALMCLLASITLFRIGPAAVRHKQFLVMLYLIFVVLICRSAGVWVYALLIGPLILIAPRRLQLTIAAVMAAVVITYPLLRGLHLVPVDDILAFATKMNEERGLSLAFRITNEDLLLAHAAERPWFGWGGYGRSLLHDPISGQISVIADGGWVITLGVYGWLGYIAEFGLLALPVFLIWREARHVKGAEVSPYASTLALILAANLFDMLPNDTLIPFTWLLAGALTGYAEALAAARQEKTRRDFDIAFNPNRTIL
ncbi:MAG: hypothetical protein K9G71_03250 [Rhodobacteraceae bacterium]|nr:hypothetical protein [Paracoccaceae bacterium]MCF8513509.1 hypothetical protein [Paracoccaceae bacterium]MCF8517591.1 hypothetical protein [Paracoccaceae bacterium]